MYKDCPRCGHRYKVNSDGSLRKHTRVGRSRGYWYERIPCEESHPTTRAADLWDAGEKVPCYFLSILRR